MALSTLTARVEDYDKVTFDDFCFSVGLTTSAAINLYVKVVVRDRKILFEIKQEASFYSAGNQSHLLKINPLLSSQSATEP